MKQFFFGSSFTGNKVFNIAWLLFRFYIGFTIAVGAGWPKMNELAAPGWFVKQVSELGFTFPSPAFWAAAAAWGEFVGGLCIAFGFFTRFSALQLAFQFFVVSFIWYKEPAPLVGMYYQQLLFWGFVLIAVAGAGKYSVDHWIMKRSATKVTVKQFATATVLLMLSLSSFAQQNPKVDAKDFQTIVGSWQGSLTYLDYTSGKPYTMPANVDVEQLGRTNRFTFSNSFPKEPNANWTDTVTIAADGLMIDKEKITSKQLLPDGNLQIVTEEMGVDGNDRKAALLRHTYTVGRDVFIKRKDVLFTGTTKWINRHEYKYTVRAKVLTPQQMKADLRILKSAWENIHPGLYRYNSKEQIENYFKELDMQTNTTLEQRRFFILLSQLNIKLRCGHSFVSYYNNKRILKGNLYSTVFLPVLFRVIEERFVITHNLSENTSLKAGDEIVAINNIPVKQIIDSLLTVSKGDGLNSRNKQLDNINIYQRDINTDRYCLFDIFFPLFFKQNINEPNYELRVKSANGKSITVTLAGLSKENRQAGFIAKYGDVPKNEKSWFLKPVNKNTIVFRLGDFATFNWKFDFKKYLDSVFVAINKAGYKNLIVDIRENEGGADEAMEAVLSYLTPKPIGCANPIRRLYRYTSIPDILLPYLDTWDENFKKPKTGYTKTADGFYESSAPLNNCMPVFSNPNHFKGKIYLITDATNSSATFIMAAAFKRNQMGTIVGETTGGTQQGINGGEIFFMYLPNSKMEMDLPLIYQAPLTPKPDAGVTPDYEVKTKVKDIAAKRDAQMEFILRNLIGKK